MILNKTSKGKIKLCLSLKQHRIYLYMEKDTRQIEMERASCRRAQSGVIIFIGSFCSWSKVDTGVGDISKESSVPHQHTMMEIIILFEFFINKNDFYVSMTDLNKQFTKSLIFIEKQQEKDFYIVFFFFNHFPYIIVRVEKQFLSPLTTSDIKSICVFRS